MTQNPMMDTVAKSEVVYKLGFDSLYILGGL